MIKKMTEEKLREIVPNSISIAEVLKTLEMSVTTANYRAFHKAVKLYNLDTNHFLGQRHLIDQNKTIGKTIHLDLILIENSTYLGIAQLKKRLIREGLLKYECYECGISTWRGNELSLQLDHINGVHNDHRIENLQLLCPNCHSQTTTFAGRKVKTNNPASKCECGNTKHKDSKNCKKCAAQKQEVISWPSKTELMSMVEAMGYSEAARQLGVSPTAIVDRIKK